MRIRIKPPETRNVGEGYGKCGGKRLHSGIFRLRRLYHFWRLHRLCRRNGKVPSFLMILQTKSKLSPKFDRGRIVSYRDIVDYLSEKSVVVLDETKQLYCGYVTVGCRRVRRTDRIHLSAPLHVRTGKLCAWRQFSGLLNTDRSVTSRTVAQHIESVTHHSVSVRTIRRRLQQSGLSARCLLLGLPLTQNHRSLCRQWSDERRTWAAEWNEVVFTDESRICLQHHDGRIQVWRHHGERMLNSCVMHRHTGHAPGIWYGVGLATAIFQQDNARPHVARIVQRFFVNQQIELLPWPARSPDLSPIEIMLFMSDQRLTQITPPAATPDQLWQLV
ncbi:transposable element Tcb1 transposase [Trichonephila clavipes]|nr:transposable element Tcb1 transposase [Trichonephila clavipes]